MKIIDASLFGLEAELDLLEIRLAELSHIVDKFYVIEATETFSGQPKPLYFNNNRERFKKWKDKIYAVTLNFAPGETDAWVRERRTREILGEIIVQQCAPCDVVILSDADEIPKAWSVCHVARRASDGCYFGLQGHLSSYYLNCVADAWSEDYCRVGNVAHLAQMGGERFRRAIPNLSIRDGCWHFSYLGGPDAVAQKLKSFAHTEYSGEHWTNRERLQTLVTSGADIVDRPERQSHFVPLDATFPFYVLENQDKFKHLIKEVA